MLAIPSVLSKKSAISVTLAFIIPVHYTDKQGKTYLFHELKPKIKNLDPKTVTNEYIAKSYNRYFFKGHMRVITP